MLLYYEGVFNVKTLKTAQNTAFNFKREKMISVSIECLISFVRQIVCSLANTLYIGLARPKIKGSTGSRRETRTFETYANFFGNFIDKHDTLDAKCISL